MDNEELEHDELSENCWCHPEVIFDFDGRQVWVHHGPGEELPPPSIIAQAIADVIADR